MQEHSDATNVYVVIMAGGSGVRLWPESRQNRPKPFLKLCGDKSLLRLTAERMLPLTTQDRVVLVVAQRFAQLVREELPELPESNLLLEPSSHNTAPCVLWAAMEILRRDPNASIVVAPADHFVAPEEPFVQTLRDALELVEQEPQRVALLGVAPTRPSNAYGYIECGETLNSRPDAYRVLSFREKPDVTTALEYLASGRFLWNSGLFVCKARRIVELFQEHARELQDLYRDLTALAREVDTDRSLATSRKFESIYNAAANISVDYAVLERVQNAAVLRAERFNWSDLGSFEALEQLPNQRAPDDARVMTVNTKNVYVRTAGQGANKLLALANLENILVVDTPDAIMIVPKGDDQAIRSLVERLKELALEEYL